MDLQAFDDARKTDLQNFEKKYASLKTQYATTISAAIREQNAASQNKLITKVLKINQTMTEEIHKIISLLSKGTDTINTATVEKLKQDLIKYQKDYTNLKKSMDVLRTLKMIQGTTSRRLATAITTYNVYLVVLFILCLIVVMMAIRAAWTTSLPRRIYNTVTQSAGLR